MPDKKRLLILSSGDENEEPVSKKQSKVATLKPVLKNLSQSEIDNILKNESKDENESEKMNISCEPDSSVDLREDSNLNKEKIKSTLNKNSSEEDDSDGECLSSLKGKYKPAVQESHSNSKSSDSSGDINLEGEIDEMKNDEELFDNLADNKRKQSRQQKIKQRVSLKHSKNQDMSSSDEENKLPKQRRKCGKKLLVKGGRKKEKMSSETDSDERSSSEKLETASLSSKKEESKDSKLKRKTKFRKRVAPKSAEDVLSTSSDSLVEGTKKSPVRRQNKYTKLNNRIVFSSPSSEDSDDQPLNSVKIKPKVDSEVNLKVKSAPSNESLPQKPNLKLTENTSKQINNTSSSDESDRNSKRGSPSKISDKIKIRDSSNSEYDDKANNSSFPPGSSNKDSDKYLNNIKNRQKTDSEVKLKLKTSPNESSSVKSKKFKKKTAKDSEQLDKLSHETSSSSDESGRHSRRGSPHTENSDKIKNRDSSFSSELHKSSSKVSSKKLTSKFDRDSDFRAFDSSDDSEQPLCNLSESKGKPNLVQNKAKEDCTKRSPSSSDEEMFQSIKASKPKTKVQHLRDGKSVTPKQPSISIKTKEKQNRNNSFSEDENCSKSKEIGSESIKRQDPSDDSSDTSLNSENEESKQEEKGGRKGKSTKKIKNSSKSVDPLLRYKKYVRTMGIYTQYNKLFEGCKSIKAKKEKIIKLMEENGLKGKPTLEKCKKIRKKNERKKEVEELDLGNIISESGRGRRNVDSLYSRNSYISSQLGSPPKKSRIKRPISEADSD